VRTPDGPDQGFTDTYLGLQDRGLVAEARAFAGSAAALRERFGPAEAGTVRTVRLADGGKQTALPQMICFPSPLTREPVLNFGSLATCFQGVLDVSVLVPPGFDRDEPLAASWDMLAGVLAEATLRCAGERPFVLTGLSAGGALAQSVATLLERGGQPPAGIVLLDTYAAAEPAPRLVDALEYGSRKVTAPESYDFWRITCAAAYVELLKEWKPQGVKSPVLVIRPTDPPQAPPGAGELSHAEWRDHWPFEHAETEVPGDHFSMVGRQGADRTAEAIHAWMEQLTQRRTNGQ
jgi:thioesterase domain-containing protein